MAWAAVGAAAIGAAGSIYSSKQNKKAAQAGASQQFQLDPRMEGLLYGWGGTKGVANQIAGLATDPQKAGLANFGNQSDAWVSNNGKQLMDNIYAGSNTLYQGNIAPTMQAAEVDAPSQNDLNLSPAFQHFIYGDSANNPALLKHLQAGIDLSNAGFQQNQANATENLMENVLPSIRSGAIAAGQYGGSRQGVAEGNAIGDYSKALTNANLQLGMANSANVTGAQANAYESGQNRALSAAQGLSGQQYGVAQQEAAMRQAADQTNINALLQTRGQNASNMIAGMNTQQNLLGNSYNYATANDAYDRTKMSQVSSMLSPFTGLGSSSTSSQPYYSNTAANALGGAAAGMSLYNQFAGMGGGGAQDLRNTWSGANSNFTVGGSGNGMFNVSPGSAGSTSWLSGIGW